MSDAPFHVTHTDPIIAPILREEFARLDRRLSEAAGEEVALFIFAGRVGSEQAEVALRVVASVILDHPKEAAVIAGLVLSELLALGLYDDADEGEVRELLVAVNGKLAEIATTRGAPAWRLVPAERPQQH